MEFDVVERIVLVLLRKNGPAIIRWKPNMNSTVDRLISRKLLKIHKSPLLEPYVMIELTNKGKEIANIIINQIEDNKSSKIKY